MDQKHPDSTDAVRLDIWLWAARFFRTRTLAKEAIEGGKVSVDGQRAKVSKSVRPGLKLLIRQGYDEVEVIVRGISGKRGGAPEARLLYDETEDSQQRREQEREQRKLAAESSPIQRPNKKARRMLERFKRDVGWH